MRLSIPANLNLDAAIDLVGALAKANEVVELRIPNEVKTLSLVAYPAFMQAVVTWGQRRGERVLRTNFPNDKEIVARYLRRNEIALLACIYATSIYGKGDENLTTMIHSLLSQTVSEKSELPQKADGQSLGTSRSIIAVDHVNEFAAPQELYRFGWRAGRRSAFIDEQTAAQYVHENLSGEALERLHEVRLPLGLKILQMSQLTPHSLGHNVETASHLGRILFELVQNTHLHARHEVDGRALERSVRLVHVRSIHQTRHKMLVANSEDPDLASYLESLPSDLPVGHPASAEEAKVESDLLRFVVVSVLDSGPGIGAKEAWASGIRSEISATTETQYLLEALRKDSAGMGRPMRGIGLKRVQELLSEIGGYARMQTGNSNISRNFVDSHYGTVRDQSQAWNLTTLGANRQSIQDPPRVSGTLITMVIPVYRLGGRRAHA